MHRIPFHQRPCWGRYLQIFIGLAFTGLLLAYQPLIVFSQEETPQSQESSAQEAQSETEEEIPTMEPVVVSATKTPVPVSHLTSAVEVITAETLKERKIKSVTEALQLSQGLVILQSGGPGATAEARIRGANSTQTLVLIDGTIMNSGTLGSYNFANLMVNDIEKIEILRGAQGMLWGADAIGGVINITTKKEKALPKPVPSSSMGPLPRFARGEMSRENTVPSIFPALSGVGTSQNFRPSIIGEELLNGTPFAIGKPTCIWESPYLVKVDLILPIVG